MHEIIKYTCVSALLQYNHNILLNILFVFIYGVKVRRITKEVGYIHDMEGKIVAAQNEAAFAKTKIPKFSPTAHKRLLPNGFATRLVLLLFHLCCTYFLILLLLLIFICS